jgi:hypothetical protein
MTAKTAIVDFLGDKALVLPALLDSAIIGNEQAKYILSLLQMAANYAECPRDTAAPSLRTDGEACGIAEASFDHTIAESSSDGHGRFHIPGAQRLVAILDDALKAMLAPLALLAGGSKEARASQEEYRERFDRLVNARPPLIDDMMSGETIASMTSGRPGSGDGLHILIMDLHKDLNRLQSEISTEEMRMCSWSALRKQVP